ETHVSIDEIIKNWTLDHEQARAFTIIAEHSMLDLPLQPLRMFMGGCGGTGKSRVINALTDFFGMRGQSRRLRLASYTGIAARNISGVTLHTALSFDVKSNGKNSSVKKKGDLTAMWEGVDDLLIDEISMVGCKLLAQISEAL
ncbi:hypothetical protein OH77DRAFT_1381547, partial [Trametes cingulata]